MNRDPNEYLMSHSAADLLAAALEAEGVDYVFGIPGEETEAVQFALRNTDVAFVPTRHEQGAAFMADVHGRLTGEAGVCLSTLGPGATNLLTGVADAHLDKSPLVAVTCQADSERLHKESHQMIDVVDMFEPVTKWNTRLHDPDIVHEAVRKAFKVAEYEKPGATHLEFPADIARAQTDELPIDPSDIVPSRPSAAALDQAEALLHEAERPIVVAGNGAVRPGSQGNLPDDSAPVALRRIGKCADVPVTSTYMGKGAVPDDDPRSLMTLETGGEDGAAGAVGQADLVLTAGYDIAEHDPADWHCPEDVPIVHVDSEPAEVYRAYDPEVEVIGDVGLALAELADRVIDATSFDADWFAPYRATVEQVVAQEGDPESPFSVRDVLPLLREAMAPGDVLISDVGAHKLAIAEAFPTYEPNTCIVSNGLASMGIAVPGGLAADRALDANVVTATGDGGFLMNAAELETATRIGCGYTVVVFVNDEYGVVAQHQREHRGESVGTDFTNPDLVAFAESFGIEARWARTVAELRDCLDVVDEDGMALIAVPVE